MDVAFTHEQADFDAVASLLGAFLLNQRIKPVLPRRYNRNVRRFINLYQTDLPFHDQKRLPAEPIDSITLVDTQSLVTPKGMSAKTEIIVIDHHALRSNLPSDWTIGIHELGACTTIFVELIKEQQVEVSVIQATLLLLGIYEDTGSLTYTRTTTRDVLAAAYLLEKGASLQIAGDYLYPPLSDEQRILYNQLLANTETHHLNGNEIIIAKAFAKDMTDEVSSAAHKIRDLLEPDALILIISTVEGIRLVARSTTNQVDVSTIASHFGGGGHKRAAAALIRLDDVPSADKAKAINQVYDELIAILPRYVLPAITVGEIMSSKPSLLRPDQSASEAAQMMQRYGYEGFPVVLENKVIGLLTRRSVDRSLAHNLDLRIDSLMEAGEVTIQPNRTLEDLQALMNDTGWGQIPVVDPRNGNVIGIVTRTDLIKTMAREKSPFNGRRNLAEKLDKALPAAHLSLLRNIAELATREDLPLYIVGGFVRDIILEVPSIDFDLVVEGNAIDLALAVKKRFGGTIVSHKRFGTAKWRITAIKDSQDPTRLQQELPIEDLPETLDFISARTEFYDHPTALPVVERSSIKLDLHRRDFSINTLALRLDGEHYGDLYDYWGGLDDVNNGYIRVLHSLSFVDDPTRLLRAVRFEQRFGFEIETRTLQLMQEAHSLINQVSGDRIRHELDNILDEERAVSMVNRLNELGLLKAISPYLCFPNHVSRQIELLIQKSPESAWNLPKKIGNANIRRALIYLIWFLNFPVSQAKGIGKRLRLSRKLMSTIVEVISAKELLLKNTLVKPSEFTTELDGFSNPTLYVLYNHLENMGIKAGIQNYVLTWRFVKPVSNGDTLKSHGVLPGPAYREILDALRNAWLDGEISSVDEESLLLIQLLKTRKFEQ